MFQKEVKKEYGLDMVDFLKSIMYEATVHAVEYHEFSNSKLEGFKNKNALVYISKGNLNSEKINNRL